MPRAAPRPCHAPGCPHLAQRRYCDQHQHLAVAEEQRRVQAARRRYDQRKGSSTARGYGQHHRKLRTIVLNEQPLCAMCDRAWATDLDHIDGNNRNTDRANLQGLCRSCHARKTAEQHPRWARGKGGSNP